MFGITNSSRRTKCSLPFLIATHISVTCFWGFYPFFFWFYTPLGTLYTTYPDNLLNLLYHSGEEVALYCSKYLPDVIKEQKTYKDGKLQKVRRNGMTVLKQV